MTVETNEYNTIRKVKVLLKLIRSNYIEQKKN